MFAEVPATGGWGARASPPPASTPLLADNKLPPSYCLFQTIGHCLSPLCWENRLLPSARAAQSWWCWVKDDERRVWGEPGRGRRENQKVRAHPSLPSCHPRNDHSAMRRMKWLPISDSLKLQKGQHKMRTMGCPRNGLSRGGGHEFSSNIDFRLYHNLALLFFKSETSAASKKSRTRVIF